MSNEIDDDGGDLKDLFLNESSIDDFDPMFEFDAPKYFDFSDTSNLYVLDNSDDNWFSEIHQDHEPEYPNVLEYLLSPEFEETEPDNEYYEIFDGTEKVECNKTPDKQSPFNYLLRKEESNKNSPKSKPGILNSLTKKLDSPLKSGPQRVKNIETDFNVIENLKKPNRILIKPSPLKKENLESAFEFSLLKPFCDEQIPPKAVSKILYQKNYNNVKISNKKFQTHVTNRIQNTKINRKPLNDILDSETSQEVAAMLAEHNKKFKTQTNYEPRKFGIKQIKQWELKSGKKWVLLNMEQRQRANQEMEILFTNFFPE